MKYFVIVILILSANASFAQLQNVTGVANTVTKSSKNSDVEGSAYLHSDWTSGTLIDKEGSVLANLFLRYNAYNGDLEMNKNGNIILIDKNSHPSFTMSFLLDGGRTETEIFKNGYTNIPNLKANDYLQTLLDGKIQLLKYVKINLVEENASSYGAQSIRKRFAKKETYYLKMAADENFSEVKISKKSLRLTLPQYSQLLESDTKKKKLKSEQDLIDLLKYFSLR